MTDIKTPKESDKQELVEVKLAQEIVIPEPFPLSICLFPFGNEYRITEVKIDPTQSPELMEWCREQVVIDREKLRKIIAQVVADYTAIRTMRGKTADMSDVVCSLTDGIILENPIKLKPK